MGGPPWRGILARPGFQSRARGGTDGRTFRSCPSGSRLAPDLPPTMAKRSGTRKSKDASGHGHPRPLLQRESWTSLNGTWDFVIDADARWRTPREVRWNGTITVPFAPETAASGVGDTGFYRRCWYRRTFDVPPLEEKNERLLLHFGAVDWAATVWVKGALAGCHEGGYTPFSLDLTDLLVEEGPQTVVVRADDDPADLAKPRGKQDWKLEPHSIWYPRTTGIWQAVWLERTHTVHVSSLRWTCNMDRWEIALDVEVAGPDREDLELSVHLSCEGRTLAHDTYAVLQGQLRR